MNETVRDLGRAVLTPVLRCAPCPLQATALKLEIIDLLAQLTLEQSYANRESQAIEVSYTIALPPDAQLLDFEAEIGGQRLRGQVEPKAVAETRYEDALAEGHSAFSIKLVGDGLLNIALGNLLPGETMLLRLRLSQLLSFNGNRLRLTLPTTIAPRYGLSDLQPQEQPHSSLLIEHRFSLEGQVRGALAAAELSSPTHRLAVRAAAGGLGFKIDNGLLDRDIVLDLHAAEQAAPRISGTLARDRNGQHAAMIAFCASQGSAPTAPVLAEFVLDCSGSMAGTSIEQARRALQAIVGQLLPADRVNVLCFGNQHQLLLRRPQPVTPLIQRTVLDAAGSLDANMGGTELMSALHGALDDLAKLPADMSGERILFIISDGEVWNPDTARFLERCEQMAVRVFAVAVGTAAVEATFLPLTRATGGALERVLPGDQMAARIQRHFERARGGLLKALEVRWPGQPGWMRGPNAIYAGDGCLLSAGQISGTEPAEAHAEVRWTDASGATHQVQVALTPTTGVAAPDDCARMLAAGWLHELDATAAAQASVDYQLINQWTALTLVLQRAADAQLQRLPELRQVPHMMVAGAMEDISFDFQMAEAAPVTGGHAIPMAAAPPPPMACPAPRKSARPPTGPVPAAPGAGASATRAGGGWSLKKLFGRQAAVREQTETYAQQAGPGWSDLLAERLLTHFRSHPAHQGLLEAGQFTLDHLTQALPLDMFNRLDELAEQSGLTLQDGSFWQALVWALAQDRKALQSVAAGLGRPTAGPQLRQRL